MGDYDVTLVRAIAQVGKMDVEELKVFFAHPTSLKYRRREQLNSMTG